MFSSEEDRDLERRNRALRQLIDVVDDYLQQFEGHPRIYGENEVRRRYVDALCALENKSPPFRG